MNSLRDLWDTIKHSNTDVLKAAEGEERGPKRICEEITNKNFSTLKKNHLHIQTSSKKSKSYTSHQIIKFARQRWRENLESIKRKWFSRYQKLTLISQQKHEARQKWEALFKVLKNFQMRIQYLENFSFKKEEKLRYFQISKNKYFVTSRTSI